MCGHVSRVTQCGIMPTVQPGFIALCNLTSHVGFEHTYIISTTLTRCILILKITKKPLSIEFKLLTCRHFKPLLLYFFIPRNFMCLLCHHTKSISHVGFDSLQFHPNLQYKLVSQQPSCSTKDRRSHVTGYRINVTYLSVIMDR